jgi:hypothetical protein
MNTIPQCHYIKTDGRRCGSPAIRGKRLCFFHGRQAPRIRKLARDGRWLPAFHAERPLEVMLAETYRLVSEGRVSLRQAQLLIYAMQITAACEKSRP